MNITNGNTISMLYGLHPDNWVGKKIQIYATPVKAFGKTQDALRIRDFKPKENVDVIEYKEKLDSAKNLTELANIWKSFPLSIKSIEQIESYKNTLKSKLTN
jgi:adenylate cyclase class IV